VFREKTQREKKWLVRQSIGKISSVQSSQLLVEVSAYGIQTEVSCQIVVSDFRNRVFHKNYVVASAR